MGLSGWGGLRGVRRGHASVIDVGITVRGADIGVMRASMSVMGVDIAIKGSSRGVGKGIIGVDIAVRSPRRGVRVLVDVWWVLEVTMMLEHHHLNTQPRLVTLIEVCIMDDCCLIEVCIMRYNI